MVLNLMIKNDATCNLWKCLHSVLTRRHTKGMPTLWANQKPSKPAYCSIGPYLMHSTFKEHKPAQIQHWDNCVHPVSGCSTQSTGRTSLPLPTTYHVCLPTTVPCVEYSKCWDHDKGHSSLWGISKRLFNSLHAISSSNDTSLRKKSRRKKRLFFSCAVPYTIKHVTKWK